MQQLRSVCQERALRMLEKLRERIFERSEQVEKERSPSYQFFRQACGRRVELFQLFLSRSHRRIGTGYHVACVVNLRKNKKPHDETTFF